MAMRAAPKLKELIRTPGQFVSINHNS